MPTFSAHTGRSLVCSLCIEAESQGVEEGSVELACSVSEFHSGDQSHRPAVNIEHGSMLEFMQKFRCYRKTKKKEEECWQ